jgi:hypothetical protein
MKLPGFGQFAGKSARLIAKGSGKVLRASARVFKGALKLGGKLLKGVGRFLIRNNPFSDKGERQIKQNQIDEKLNDYRDRSNLDKNKVLEKSELSKLIKLRSNLSSQLKINDELEVSSREKLYDLQSKKSKLLEEKKDLTRRVSELKSKEVKKLDSDKTNLVIKEETKLNKVNSDLNFIESQIISLTESIKNLRTKSNNGYLTLQDLENRITKLKDDISEDINSVNKESAKRFSIFSKKTGIGLGAIAVLPMMLEGVLHMFSNATSDASEAEGGDSHGSTTDPTFGDSSFSILTEEDVTSDGENTNVDLVDENSTSSPISSYTSSYTTNTPGTIDTSTFDVAPSSNGLTVVRGAYSQNKKSSSPMKNQNIGKLYLGGKYFCDTYENKPIEPGTYYATVGKKYGSYSVKAASSGKDRHWYYENQYLKKLGDSPYMTGINNTHNRLGIRIHTGSGNLNTGRGYSEGCLVLGDADPTGRILNPGYKVSDTSNNSYKYWRTITKYIHDQGGRVPITYKDKYSGYSHNNWKGTAGGPEEDTKFVRLKEPPQITSSNKSELDIDTENILSIINRDQLTLNTDTINITDNINEVSINDPVASEIKSEESGDCLLNDLTSVLSILAIDNQIATTPVDNIPELIPINIELVNDRYNRL